MRRQLTKLIGFAVLALLGAAALGSVRHAKSSSAEFVCRLGNVDFHVPTAYARGCDHPGPAPDSDGGIMFFAVLPDLSPPKYEDIHRAGWGPDVLVNIDYRGVFPTEHVLVQSEEGPDWDKKPFQIFGSYEVRSVSAGIGLKDVYVAQTPSIRPQIFTCLGEMPGNYNKNIDKHCTVIDTINSEEGLDSVGNPNLVVQYSFDKRYAPQVQDIDAKVRALVADFERIPPSQL